MSWLLAEFPDAPTLVEAVRGLRERGFERLQAYTPYPVAELWDALGYKPSVLPKLVFLAAMAGAAGAYVLQWWINVRAYPLNVGGRPYHFPLAFFPITFEMGVLTAALVAFVSILVVGRLFRLWRPVFESPAFRSATRDRCWLRLPSGGAERELTELLERAGATRVERLVVEGS